MIPEWRFLLTVAVLLILELAVLFLFRADLESALVGAVWGVAFMVPTVVVLRWWQARRR